MSITSLVCYTHFPESSFCGIHLFIPIYTYYYLPLIWNVLLVLVEVDDIMSLTLVLVLTYSPVLQITLNLPPYSMHRSMCALNWNFFNGCSRVLGHYTL
jgi:Na+-transporting NADH:ubiquinone oxidoreductase subunit NqrB